MDLDLALNSGVGAASYDSNNPTGGSFHEFSTDDRFNYAPFNYVLTPSRRFGAFTQAQYKITDNTAFNAKILYANRNSKNQAAPEPLFIGPEAGNGNRLDRIVVDSTNPYNPLGFSLDASTDYFIGRRPVAAFGNSDGDQQMLEWTAGGKGARLMLLVHHTDAEREYAYDRQSAIGRLDTALDEANAKGWIVVDMKNDWKTIFPPLAETSAK